MKNQTNDARLRVYLLALVGLMGVATLLLGPGRLVSAQAVAPSWSYSSNLNIARNGHTATLLPNGKVLVAGGAGDGGYFNSAELYDPVSESWINTGTLNAPRGVHTSTLLQNGKVLVVGGFSVGGGRMASAELYDSATGTWSYTGSLNTGRAGHTATLLLNGNVLVVAGGHDNCIPSCSTLNTAELYDSATGTWSNTGSLNFHRDGHAATLLSNGKVLVTGGFASTLAELYDPGTGTWSRTGDFNTGRSAHTAILLPNGDVLVAGGLGNCDTIDGASPPA